MQTTATEALAPPPGFRKAIPVNVKFDAVIREGGKCKACGEKLEAWSDTQFDHIPALQLRGWDPVEEDTIPPANDPDHIHAKHKDCHAAKTTGRKGTSRLNALHGDTAEIAKLRRLTREQEAFNRRLLAKDEPEPEEDRPKPKSRWPKRPFNQGSNRGSSGSRLARDDDKPRENTRH